MVDRAILLGGQGFGDECKGKVTNQLALLYGADTVARYGGGAQAAHNVVMRDGRHHTFSQFGSGTFIPGCRTHLSRFMLVNPVAMQAEEQHLRAVGVEDAFDRMTVEREALVTTPFHVSMNRLREMARRKDRHGSCGMGIGETASDALEYGDYVLRVKDLDDEATLRRKLTWLRDLKLEELSKLSPCPSTAFEEERSLIFGEPDIRDAIVRVFLKWRSQVTVVDRDYLKGRNGTVVFEGHQGVLLDEDYGFHPHTTWSHTTFKNALELIEGFNCEVQKIGILRAYTTRHGAGPFPTEDINYRRCSSHDHNTFGTWQEHFRSGALDLVLAKYALDVVGGVDSLALTCLDRIPYVNGTPSVCTRYLVSSVDDTLFHGDNGRITGIKFNPTVDLNRQERLTKALFDVRAGYVAVPPEAVNGGRAYADFVGSELGVRISLMSSGPTAEDTLSPDFVMDRSSL